MSIVIAIDGPAGSGKGTLAKKLSEKFNLINIDTGAMYRCVALECLNKDIKEDEIEKMLLEYAEIIVENYESNNPENYL